jgi:hypothetical protein
MSIHEASLNEFMAQPRPAPRRRVDLPSYDEGLAMLHDAAVAGFDLTPPDFELTAPDFDLVLPDFDLTGGEREAAP